MLPQIVVQCEHNGDQTILKIVQCELCISWAKVALFFLLVLFPSVNLLVNSNCSSESEFTHYF